MQSVYPIAVKILHLIILVFVALNLILLCCGDLSIDINMRGNVSNYLRGSIETFD